MAAWYSREQVFSRESNMKSPCSGDVHCQIHMCRVDLWTGLTGCLCCESCQTPATTELQQSRFCRTSYRVGSSDLLRKQRIPTDISMPKPARNSQAFCLSSCYRSHPGTFCPLRQLNSPGRRQKGNTRSLLWSVDSPSRGGQGMLHPRLQHRRATESSPLLEGLPP